MVRRNEGQKVVAARVKESNAFDIQQLLRMAADKDEKLRQQREAASAADSDRKERQKLEADRVAEALKAQREQQERARRSFRVGEMVDEAAEQRAAEQRDRVDQKMREAINELRERDKPKKPEKAQGNEGQEKGKTTQKPRATADERPSDNCHENAQRRRPQDTDSKRGHDRASERAQSERKRREADERERPRVEDYQSPNKGVRGKVSSAAEYEVKYHAFEERAKKRAQITYDDVPWPAKGGSAEFVINFGAKHLSNSDRRKLVLQWSRRWHPDTWARSWPRPCPCLLVVPGRLSMYLVACTNLQVRRGAARSNPYPCSRRYVARVGVKLVWKHVRRPAFHFPLLVPCSSLSLLCLPRIPAVRLCVVSFCLHKLKYLSVPLSRVLTPLPALRSSPLSAPPLRPSQTACDALAHQKRKCQKKSIRCSNERNHQIKTEEESNLSLA